MNRNAKQRIFNKLVSDIASLSKKSVLKPEGIECWYSEMTFTQYKGHIRELNKDRNNSHEVEKYLNTPYIHPQQWYGMSDEEWGGLSERGDPQLQC